MHSTDRRRLRSTAGSVIDAERRDLGPAGRLRRLVLCAAVMGFAACGSGPLATSASADGTVTLPGGPLVVSVGSLGECQSNYPNVGVNFFPPGGTLGDCGFFLAFPPEKNPPALKLEGNGTVYGFEGAAGPHIGTASGGVLYTELKQLPTTGSGTTTDPYTEVTTFKVRGASDKKDYALVTVTTAYVNGLPQFDSFYDVQNVTEISKPGELEPPAAPSTLFFHAIAAGDLFVANDDHGTGVFLGGPPRFIGGQNAHTGTLGGFIGSAPAWTNWQEGEWNSVIWEAVRNSPLPGPVFNDTIDPTLLDNGAGVSWDEYLTKGLAPGEHARFAIINRTQVPSTLSVQPVNQSLTAGQTATIKVTATDNVGTPYAGRTLVYSIGGANAKAGSVTTDAAGVATISYVGTAAGLDTIQMFLDLAGTGVQATQDPSAAAQITWAPPPPAPNSTYKIQSIHANSDGTITIVFVPTQAGVGTLEVTVPTGTISRKQALAAKKKCKKDQIKIKGKCRAKTTLSGRVSATGVAGVPLSLTVKASSKVKRALKKGRTVVLAAKLTYRSALGGTPTVQVFHFTIKPKKKHHH